MTQKFTTPCFIRKNTEELRKKLEELGYKTLNSGNTTLDAHNFDGKGHHKHINEGTAIITSYGGYYGVVYVADDVTNKGRIDCGTNEDLFLALAALSEDNDYMQWFVDKRGVFVQCKYRQIQEFVDRVAINGYDIGGDWLRKATVEEIIEHFKD